MLYRRLADLPERDWPATYRIAVKQYIAPTVTPDAPWNDPCRFSEDFFVRWCVSCDTVLPANGQSAFCQDDRTAWASEIRKRKRWYDRGSVDVDRRALIELFRYAQNLDQSLGRLSRKYNYDPTNLSDHMDTAMRDSKMLLQHLELKIDNPTRPGEREDT